ncbi:hypothetical protein D3C81_1895890 [compost metagenome]
MTLGLEPAGQVDRKSPAGLHDAVIQRAMALASRRQPHGFVDQQFGDSETVVDLGEIDVGQRHVRAAQRVLNCSLRTFEGQQIALGNG